MLQFISAASSLEIASLTFGLIFGTALLGFLLQRVLPPHYFSNGSKDAAKLAAGLIATLSALSLGLLIASSKGTFEDCNKIMNETAVDYIHLDRLLADFGPQTAPIREELRNTIHLKLQRIWPEENRKEPPIPLQAPSKFELIAREISSLSPQNAFQKELQKTSLKLAASLLHKRWIVEFIALGSPPPLLLLIPVIWISLLMLLYSLFSPLDFTVMGVFFFCSFSIAGALFLISEMSTPLDGSIKISSAPLHLAMNQLGK